IAGLAAVAVVALATGARSIVDGDRVARRRAVVLVALLVAMALATLINPYGPALHTQAIDYLGQPSTARFAESLSPNFRSGGASIRAFEALLMAFLLLLGTGWATPTWGSLALVLCCLHMALTSVRNINLFAIVATPPIALGVTHLMAARWPRLAAR